MKTYELNTPLTFGKYKGQTIKDVLGHSPEYITWCLSNLDHFYISQETLESCMPNIVNDPLPQSVIDLIKSKEKAFYEDSHDTQDEYDPIDRWHNNRTFWNYNGSYAQDEMGFSDQDIDDVFDGDPDMYWNID